LAAHGSSFPKTSAAMSGRGRSQRYGHWRLGAASFVGLLEGIVQRQHQRQRGTSMPHVSSCSVPPRHYNDGLLSSSQHFTKSCLLSLPAIVKSTTCLSSHGDNKSMRISIQDLQEEMATLNNGQIINVNSAKQVSMALFGSDQQSVTKKVLEQMVNGNQQQNDMSSVAVSTAQEKQRRLAQLILQYKEAFKQQGQPPEPVTGRQTEPTFASTSTKAISTRPFSSSTSSPLIFSSATDTKDSSDVELSSPLSQQPKNLDVPQHVESPAATTLPTRTFSKSPFEQQVEALFDKKNRKGADGKIDSYWKDPLKLLSKSTARSLVVQLDATQCPMGFNPNATPQDPSGLETVSTARKTGGTFLDYCRSHKALYPHAIQLVRCGDFYETFGVDAIMLVEHVGLNSMAGKLKAGCPYRNIQATLDGLTSNGFTVAVHEEVGTAITNSLQRKQPLGKTRCLTQLVSPATPTYLYDNWLSSSSTGGDYSSSLDMLPLSRPCVGIVSTSTGYQFLEVWLEEQVVKVAERLTGEAVTCRLLAYPPAEPLLYIPSPTEYTSYQQSPSKLFSKLEFLSASATQISQAGGNINRFVKTQVLPPMVLAEPKVGTSDTERYSRAIVQAILQRTEAQPRPGDEKLMETARQGGRRPKMVEDFTVVLETSPESSSYMGGADSTPTTTRTNPLYVETATQLGLLHHTNSHIPNLVNCLVDSSAPRAARRFLQRYLLCPPPPMIAESLACLVQKEMSISFGSGNTAAASALPPLHVPPLGKILALLRVGQAGASIFGDLIQSLAGTQQVLQMESFQYQQQENDPNETNDTRWGMSPMQALLQVLHYESGIASSSSVHLANQCYEAQQAIQAILSPQYHIPVQQTERQYTQEHDELKTVKDAMSDFEHIPSSFIERNEMPWRGRVRPSVARDAYHKVEQAASKLNSALQEDFVHPFLEDDDDSDDAKKAAKKRPYVSQIVYDVFNNVVALKKAPTKSKDHDHYFPSRDRHGKTMRDRLTTTKVQSALSEYTAACDEACTVVSTLLTELAQRLEENGHIPAIVQSAHINLILSTIYAHASKASTMGWNLAEAYEPTVTNKTPRLVNVWPYWMDRSQAVPNTFALDGLFLLTAPNMSGKSTLMRSTAAAALLTMCGLCAPLDNGSRLPRIDTLFVRGASADVPSEGKSAFGAEMGDIAALLRCCGKRSWIFVDELGRGTSPTDGTRLAGAVLEAMATAGMSGMFATHLHDLLHLPLRGKERTPTKRMAIQRKSTILKNRDEEIPTKETSYEWTYKLEDGVCTDSLALVTAARFGLPHEIIRRADELGFFLAQKQDEATSMLDNNWNYNTVPSYSDSSNGVVHAATNVNGSNHIKKDWFDIAVAMAEDVTGVTSSRIPPCWSPPAALCAGSSCIYVLEVPHDNKRNTRYYVGETDSLQQRLQQHRQRGGAWATSQAVALVASSKTEARLFESILIQKMAKAGIPLESIQDGRSIRPAGRSKDT
jgi:DNA mismatch repair ATPase MutS